MVRGRRVRAVVACSRNDECCSPNPKRKDPGVINGNLLQAILSPSRKTQTITQFFQTVGVDIDENGSDDLLLVDSVQKDGCEQDMLNDGVSDLDDGAKEEFTEIITTPNPKNVLRIEDLFSPPTPHRIELCIDDDEEKAENDPIKEREINSSPKKMNTSKARRRLKNNQTSNQQLPIKADKNGNSNHKLTEYFPVRRSARKTNKVVLEEKQRTLEHMLRKGIECGLRITNFEDKGRGIVADQIFNKGDFVVEYSGDLIDIVEARQREVKYAQDQNAGCYMYYFKHKGLQYCIDATAETGRLGRLVNHSRNGNLITRTVDVDGKPHLVLVAKDTIEIGQEVTYDYGDRSKESLRYHPWLAY